MSKSNKNRGFLSFDNFELDQLVKKSNKPIKESNFYSKTPIKSDEKLIKKFNRLLFKCHEDKNLTLEKKIIDNEDEMYKMFSIEPIFDHIFSNKGISIIFQASHDYDDSTPYGPILEIYKYDNKYICFSGNTYQHYYWRDRDIGIDSLDKIYDTIIENLQIYSEKKFLEQEKFRIYSNKIKSLKDKVEFYTNIGVDPKKEILKDIDEIIISID